MVFNLGFLDRSRYFLIQVTPQLSSRGPPIPIKKIVLPQMLVHRKGKRKSDIGQKKSRGEEVENEALPGRRR
jgi:hypothetical protein